MPSSWTVEPESGHATVFYDHQERAALQAFVRQFEGLRVAVRHGVHRNQAREKGGIQSPNFCIFEEGWAWGAHRSSAWQRLRSGERVGALQGLR
jgi:hypothetical protein